MGASDSKLTFKQGIFRLSEPKQIPADDEYWTGFWELPESTEDVFSLFSPADIRRTRDNNLANLETLILAVTSRLVVLRNHPSFPDPDLAPERDALNCIRVLTRLLPFVYEADHLESWEDTFFWAERRKRSRRGQLLKSEVIFDESDPDPTPTEAEPEFTKAKPLAEEIIDTLIDLLFFSEFTLPKVPAGKNKVSYAIWQSGVGCNTPVASTKEFESNRTEILRLLLAFASKSMYMSAAILPVKGVRAITYMATCPEKQVVLSVLCSMLNTTLKYNPATWRVPYDHVVFKDQRQILVTYCLQLLLVLILYPIPEAGNGPAPKNFFRHFLGRLHRPQDFQFLVDGMTRILNQPLQANTSYLPGSHKSLTWAPEMIMLFWEALQCNKRFRSFIVDTDRAHDFVVLLLYYAIDQRNDPSKQGLVRMCVFVLQTLSVEPQFGKSLNKVFEGQETLPPSIRIPNFHGTYADYVITSIYTLLTTGKGKLEPIYPALLAILNNIAAYMQNLGRAPSSKMLQLFASMSSPSFLLANDNNHTLLHSLLEAINAMVEHQYEHNPNLVYAIVRSKKKFQALRDFTLESGQEEIERQNQLRKEGDGADLSRQTSIDSLRSPTAARTPSLGNVPEENSAFAIGSDDDEDSDAEEASPPPQTVQPPPSGGSRGASRSASIASSIDESVPLQLRGMSEKARGKMPVGQPTFSRQNSTTSLASFSATPSLGANGFFTPSVTWLESWLSELPLHTTLMLIQTLSPLLDSSTDTTTALNTIKSTNVPGIEPSPIRVHLFEWSTLSLGWYESLLWGFVFASEMVVAKGTAGVWNNTSIRLFRVQQGESQTPSLLAPRGAVDAVGSNLVQRIGSLNLGRAVPGGAAPAPAGRGAGTGGAQTGTIQEDIDAIVPYSMHVSSRYLDLTKQKLELTRLPKENETLTQDEQWTLGTPKSVLEPLLDHWLETYDWRAQESIFNTTLPQFRTLITLPSLKPTDNRKPIRTHFVHARSSVPNAIPLLYIHSWPGSFIEIQHLIPHLVTPQDTGAQDTFAETQAQAQAFHVICPSIPGFGFSDASEEANFGIQGAAEVFGALMQRLGYESYVVCGGGWGFDVASALAMKEPGRCKGVFTWNPVFRAPTLREKPLAWAKWMLARAMRARYPSVSFGYTPAEVGQINNTKGKGKERRPLGPVMHQLFSMRPQTLAFSMCDSPIGLLAVLLDLVVMQGPASSLSVRPRSPFLDPGELEMQDREYEAAGHERVRSDDTVKAGREGGVDAGAALAERRAWTPTDILNWTMMMWLPGAEAGLR
ncbi:hypothetical protein E8E11_000094, partial [Didymella keratinophila]